MRVVIGRLDSPQIYKTFSPESFDLSQVPKGWFPAGVVYLAVDGQCHRVGRAVFRGADEVSAHHSLRAAEQVAVRKAGRLNRAEQTIAIWSEDAVRFMPGSPPDVGKQAILADNEKFGAKYPGFKVLSYAAKYKNIQIEDGLACEWGEHESQFKLSPEAPPVNFHGKGFHVLKRQSDGSWKFAVLILNQ